MNHKNAILTGFLAVSSAFFGIAQAQGPGPGPAGDGARPEMRKSAPYHHMADPAARVDQRLARLKSDLKITASQEPLWQAFAEKSKEEAGKGFQAMREQARDDKPVTAPERMARMQAIMKDRLAAMESVNESFKRLYDALSPTQQAAADKHFSRMAHRERGPGRDWREGRPPVREGKPQAEPAK